MAASARNSSARSERLRSSNPPAPGLQRAGLSGGKRESGFPPLGTCLHHVELLGRPERASVRSGADFALRGLGVAQCLVQLLGDIAGELLPGLRLGDLTRDLASGREEVAPKFWRTQLVPVLASRLRLPSVPRAHAHDDLDIKIRNILLLIAGPSYGEAFRHAAHSGRLALRHWPLGKPLGVGPGEEGHSPARAAGGEPVTYAGQHALYKKNFPPPSGRELPAPPLAPAGGATYPSAGRDSGNAPLPRTCPARHPCRRAAPLHKRGKASVGRSSLLSSLDPWQAAQSSWRPAASAVAAWGLATAPNPWVPASCSISLIRPAGEQVVAPFASGQAGLLSAGGDRCCGLRRPRLRFFPQGRRRGAGPARRPGAPRLSAERDAMSAAQGEIQPEQDQQPRGRANKSTSGSSRGGWGHSQREQPSATQWRGRPRHLHLEAPRYLGFERSEEEGPSAAGRYRRSPT